MFTIVVCSLEEMENQFYEMKIGIIECKNLYVERVRIKDFLNSNFFTRFIPKDPMFIICIRILFNKSYIF